MKSAYFVCIVIAALFFATRSLSKSFMSPEEAAKRIEAGTAVLIDVRESNEWTSTGVAAPAVLLSLSDLRGKRIQWTTFLKQNKDKELILYCRSGNRSGVAEGILAEEGYTTANVGGFKHWVAAELPIRQVESN